MHFGISMHINQEVKEFDDNSIDLMAAVFLNIVIKVNIVLSYELC